MPPFKHLIFDCDGVIVDSEIVATRISLRKLAPYGYQVDELTHAERYAGLLETDIIARLRSEEGLDLPADFGGSIVKEIRDRMFEELQPVPGMTQLLRSLDQPLAVVSNSQVDHVQRSLALAQVADLIGDRIFSAQQVAQPKPHPDVYLHAVGRLNYDPEFTLVVEDSVAGVTAARQAGLTVVGFLGASHISAAHADRLRAADVNMLVQNAEELQAVLTQQLGIGA
jgi:HAD superfamily hydrolase (TIGR01509 family)